MFTNQRLRRVMHPGRIQWPVDPGDLTLLDTGPHLIVADDIPIAPIDRGKTGMKVAFALPRPVHGYICRQGGIDAHHPGTQIPDRRGFKVGHLVTGMHSRIGAPGTDQVNRMIGYPRNRPVQFVLDGSDAGFLMLPAVIVATVVLENKRHTAITNGCVRGQCLVLLEQWNSRVGESHTKNADQTRDSATGRRRSN